LFVGLAAGGHVPVPLSLIAQPAQLAFILGHADCRAVSLTRQEKSAACGTGERR
jgi:long-subunit acyl-CoA synthetase (AMP-forming)